MYDTGLRELHVSCETERSPAWKGCLHVQGNQVLGVR